jgi:prepilin-type processing-associated H-X9-DG protein
MKISLSKRNHGMTLIELFVIVVVLALLAAALFPAMMRAKDRAMRISCTGCLKNMGLSFRIWEGDHTNNFPMMVPQTNGGTMEFTSGPNVFRHFQVMSNELSNPILLICPADSRVRTTDFAQLSNSNISYFVGVDANETNPQMILSGDHNITNGTPLKNSILEATTNFASGWTAEMHNKVGNILLADGSVQQMNTSGLRKLVENTGLATNRLQMP